jgi:hypothetical protein
MMTSVDKLEQTYRRTYRRLTVGMFIAYAVVLGVALSVFLTGPAAVFWARDGAPSASPLAGALQSAGPGGETVKTK